MVKDNSNSRALSGQRPFEAWSNEHDPKYNVDDIEDAVLEAEHINTSSYNPSDIENQKIAAYIETVDEWKNADTVDDAIRLDRARQDRLNLMKGMSSVLHDERLKNYKQYIAADIADLTPADVRSEDYADLVRRKAFMREALLGEDTFIGARAYEQGITTTQEVIAGGRDVREEYELLDTRRDAVQEHFDDPRFIAEVGLSANGKFEDELMFDMDRGDLSTPEARARSSAASKAFRDNVRSLDPSSPGNAIEGFMKLQGMSEEMLNDHGAVIDFARITQPFVNDDLGYQNQVRDDRTYLNGLAAMDPVPWSNGAAQDFWMSLKGKDLEAIQNGGGKDPAILFSLARAKFERDLANPNSGDANPALSFAVMKKSAERIYDLGPSKINELIAPVDGNDGEAGRNAAAFLVFQREEDIKRGRSSAVSIKSQAAEGFRGKVHETLAKNGDLTEERTVTEKSSTRVSLSDEEQVELAIGKKDRVEIRVLDGAHMAVTRWNDGFAKSDNIQDVLKAGGPDLTDPSVMKQFLGKNHAAVVKGLGAAGFEEAARKSGVSQDDFNKVMSRSVTSDDKEVGGASRSERMALAFKLGLGESVLQSCGLGQKAFSDLATGKIKPSEFNKLVKDSGLDSKEVTEALGKDAISAFGLTKEDTLSIANSGDSKRGLRAYRGISAVDASFRLNGIVAPPDNGECMTTDGKLDAGAASREHADQVLCKLGIDRSDASSLSFEFEKSADGKEEVMSVLLPDGRYLSDVMLQDGFALPVDGEARNRKEKFAQTAVARGKGLHKHGFPDDDGEWMRDRKCPKLTALEKTEKLYQTVANSMAGSASEARRRLEMRETQVFALPLEHWTNSPTVDANIAEVVKNNPKKVQKIYANNMEILNDLRARNKEGKLTEDEKLAHDRLSVGRRALAQAFVHRDPPLMTQEQAEADSHKLLSAKAGRRGKFRENVVKATEKTAEVAGATIKSAGRGAMNVTKSAMDFAMGD